MGTTTDERVHDLGRRWAEAEQRADVGTLDALTTDDLPLVGPRGFVLDKQQWLHRYRTGALITRSPALQESRTRHYGDTAIVVGLHTQQASHEGRAVDGRFRATHLAARRGDRRLLTGLHLSPVGSPEDGAAR
jgi:ketosteroid isomerase-like protein